MSNSDLQQAVAALQDHAYTCVVCKDGQQYVSAQRGIRPLLTWLDDPEIDLRGFSAADKVVGNGAAYLYVLLGISAVYALVMSKAALITLASHGITVSYESLVDQIQNRDKTGLCPMEQAVAQVQPDHPEEALALLRATLKKLSEQ